MKLLTVLALFVFAAAALPVICLEDLPDIVEPQPSCPPMTGAIPFSIDAYGPIEQVGVIIRATGGLLFLKGNQRVTASEATYNIDSGSGVMRDVVFTTCQNENSHYRVVAKEITFLPGNRINAHNVSLYIGRLRVLTVPSLKMRIGGRAASSSVFPRPSYDRYNGFTLSQMFRLMDTDRIRTTVNLTATTNHGIMGELGARYGIDGTLDPLPGRFLSYDSLRSAVLSLPQMPSNGPCDPQALWPVEAARLRAFGTATIRQCTFDIRNPRLIVSRQPEMGLSYIGSGLSTTRQKLDPRIEIYPEINLSWGRFKETPGLDVFTQRNYINGVLPVNLLPLGSNTAVQPIFSYRYSVYSNKNVYKLWQYAVDVSHLFSNGSFISGRYIQRNDSGQTPFIFDELDISREFQAAFQANSGRKTFGLVMSYNMDNSQLYEWEAMYAYRTDCTSTWIRWNSRLQRFSFDVTLINL